MITYLDRVCFGAAASSMASDLGLGGVSDLKWAFVAFSISYGLFEIPGGWLGDRWGPRGTLIRIVAWWSVFTALTGLVGWAVGSFSVLGRAFGPLTLGGLSALVVLRFCFGAGEAGAYPNITRAIHNWFPKERWETAQGMVWMSGRLAGGLTPFLWAILVAGTDSRPPLIHWRGAFFLFGLVGLLWCTGFAIWFRNRPEEHAGVNEQELELIGSHPETSEDHRVPWVSLFTNRSVLALCLMYSLINYGWGFNITYLASYLKERYLVPDNDLWGAIYKGAPLWVGAVGCVTGGIVVNAVSKRLGDRRRGRQYVCMAALLMCAVCWWFAPSAPNMHWFCLLISMGAFGIDMTLGAAWASCQDIGQRHAGVTAACMNMIGTFGAAAAGWVTGSIVGWTVEARAESLGVAATSLSAEAKRLAEIDGFASVFSTYAVVYVVAALCWLAIDPRRTVEKS
jgi:ACS family glucarate transporter-like MFS transporter